SSAWGPGRRLFWMQIRGPTSRHVSVQPIFEGRTARQTSRHDITSERLAFHDCDVWLARTRNQIIGGGAANVPGRTPMKRKGNLVHSFSIDLKRSSASTDERTCFNGAAQGNDAYIIAILYLELGS